MKSSVFSLTTVLSALSVTVSALPASFSVEPKYLIPRNTSSSSAADGDFHIESNGIYYTAAGFYGVANVDYKVPNQASSLDVALSSSATNADYNSIIDRCRTMTLQRNSDLSSFIIAETRNSGVALHCYIYDTPFDSSMLGSTDSSTTIAFNKGCAYQKDMPLMDCMITQYDTVNWLQQFQNDIRWDPSESTTWIEQMAMKYFKNSADFHCTWASEVGCTINFVAPETTDSSDAINAYLVVRSYQGYLYYLTGVANAIKASSLYVPSRTSDMVAKLYVKPKSMAQAYADAQKAQENFMMGVWGLLCAGVPVPGAAALGRYSKFAWDNFKKWETVPSVSAQSSITDIVKNTFDAWKTITQSAYDDLLKQPINAQNIVQGGRYLYTDVGRDSPYTKVFEQQDSWTQLFDRMIFRCILQYSRNFIHLDNYGSNTKASSAGNTAGFFTSDGKYAFPVNYRYDLYAKASILDTDVLTKYIRDTPEWGQLSSYGISATDVMNSAISWSRSSVSSFGSWSDQWPALSSDAFSDLSSPLDLVTKTANFWAIPVCDINRFEGQCVGDQKVCGGHDHDSYWDRSIYRNSLSPNQLGDVDNLGMDSWCAWKLQINPDCGAYTERVSFGIGDRTRKC